MSKFKITAIQLFDYSDRIQISEGGDYETRKSYSANIAINDKFIVQVSSSGKIDIPASSDCAWNDDDSQDYAHENIDVYDVIDETGIETEREWLIKNGAEIMTSENVNASNL